MVFHPNSFLLVKAGPCCDGKLPYADFWFNRVQNSFHGRTFASMALTNSKTYYRAGFGPLLGGTFAAQYPYCLHCKTRQATPGGSDWYKVRNPEHYTLCSC